MPSDTTPPADGPQPIQRPGRDRHREPPVIDAKAEPVDPASADAPPETTETVVEAAPAPVDQRTPFPTLPVAVAVALALSAGATYLAWQQSGSTATPPDDLTQLRARLEKLETAPRPGPAATPEQLAALERRLSALEQRPSAPAGTSASTPAPAPAPAVNLAPIENRIAAVEKIARDAATAAANRPAAPAPAAPVPLVDLSPVENRISALEAVQAAPKTAVRATEDPAVQANRGPDKTALAVVAQALAETIDRGRPYKLELAAAEALGVEAAKLAPLKPLADKGIATSASLARSFSFIASKVAAAGEPPSDGQSLVDRLTASASKLVRVRPAGEARGDDVPTLVSRIEVSLGRGDVATAIADIDRLPPASKAIAAPVAEQARQRMAALAAASSLRDAALSALARPKD